MSRWRITDPDGWSEVVNPVAVNGYEFAFPDHDMAGCIWAGCRDAYGWKAENLDTGGLVLTEFEERRWDLHA